MIVLKSFIEKDDGTLPRQDSNISRPADARKVIFGL